MADIDVKKLDTVEGRKVNHPHSGPNIVYAAATIVFALFPLLYLFIPTIANEGGVNGIQIIKFFGLALSGEVTPTTGPSALFDDPTNLLLSLLGLVKAEYKDSAFAFIMVFAVIMFILFTFSLVKIVIGVVHLAKGYFKKTNVIPAIGAVEFTLSVVYIILLLFFYGWVFDATAGYAEENLIIWFMFVPVGISLFYIIFLGAFIVANFRNSILESEIEIVKLEQPKPEPVVKKTVVKKVKVEEQNSSISPDTTIIGGHAYAENQNLRIATIPLGVNKLGRSAFANCLNLTVVSIPGSVIEIGQNCFFNCASLERINYSGTKEQWSRIKRGSNWLARAKTTQVVCVDGTIAVNPYN